MSAKLVNSYSFLSTKTHNHSSCLQNSSKLVKTWVSCNVFIAAFTKGKQSQSHFQVNICYMGYSLALIQ